MYKLPNLYIFFCLGVLCETSSNLSLIKEPRPIQYVKKGDPITLDCVFSGKVSECFWMWNDSTGSGMAGLVNLLEFTKDGTYELPGDMDKGDCTLKIKSANFTRDDGTWVCHQRKSPSNDPVWSREAKVIILVMPEGPTIPNRRPNGRLYLEKGKKQNVTCFTENGNPAASLSWKLNQHVLNNQITIVNKNKTTKLLHVTSILTLQAEVSMDKSNLTCYVQFKGFNITEKHTQVTLSVHYKTTTVSLVHELNTVVKEGGQVKFICKADGNPPPGFQWMHKSLDSNKWTIVGNEAVLIISPVSKTHAGSYLCFAGNTRNMISSEESTLEVESEEGLTMSSIIGITVPICALFVIGISLGLVCYLKQKMKKNEGLPSVYLDMRQPKDVKKFSDVPTDSTETNSTETDQLRKTLPLPPPPPPLREIHEYLVPLPPIAETDEYMIPDVCVKSPGLSSPESIHSKRSSSSSSSHIYEDPHIYENRPAHNESVA